MIKNYENVTMDSITDNPFIGQAFFNFEVAGAGTSSTRPSEDAIGPECTCVFEGDRTKWSELPDITLALIASFILPCDRAKMAMTCKNWNRIVMMSPHLWRSAKMRFHGNYKDLEHVAYAKSVGRYLKKLQIYGGVQLGIRAKRFQRAFTSMFQSLYSQGPVQLLELSVTDLQFQNQFQGYNYDNSSTRKLVMRSLNRFLKWQSHLECLDLSNATVNLDEGIRLLRSAANRSNVKLKYLYLDDMFQENVQAGFNLEFVDVVGRYKTLVDLSLNYSCVSDNLLTRLSVRCDKSLKFIHIQTHHSDTHQHSIDPTAWYHIQQAIPHLRVKITISCIIRITDIQRLLARNMPLQSVNIYGHNDDGFHPDRTLKHLARYFRDTLQKIVIDVGPVYRAFSRGLVALIKDCVSLRYVELHGRVQWLILREIFEHIDETYLRKNLSPSLTTLKIVIMSVGQEEPDAEILVMEEFRPLFESRNLDYEVEIDPYMIYRGPFIGPNPQVRVFQIHH